MAKIKQMNIVAQEIANDIMKEINNQCDWQLDQFLPESSEGKLVNQTHSYLVRLVANHIQNNANNE